MVNLTEHISNLENVHFASGGFAVLHRADYWDSSGEAFRKVAIKFPNVRLTHCCNEGQSHRATEATVKLLQRWNREIIAGQHVLHPNILPFLGFYDNPDKQYKEFSGIVLPYCPNGDARNYTHVHPEADRLHILCGVAAALFALHSSSPPIVHGDIKASNILIDAAGNALLSDFGLSRICEATGFTTSSVGGTLRWMSIELLTANCEDEPFRTTTASDIWAFAMAILEVLTGERPFAEVKRDVSVLCLAVLNKARPRRPRNPRVTDMIWELLEQCWQEDPDARPDARHVGLVLDIIYGGERNLDLTTASAMLNGELNGCFQQDLLSQPDRGVSSYQCKWPNCRQAFETTNECIEHECFEFQMRLSASRCWKTTNRSRSHPICSALYHEIRRLEKDRFPNCRKYMVGK